MVKPTRQSRRIAFTVGGKGGTGKSFVLSQLLDWNISENLPTLVFDTDSENNTLSRFCQNDTGLAVRYIDTSQQRNLDAMLDEIIKSDKTNSLIDMRAASTEHFQKWFRMLDFTFLSTEFGLRWTAISVIDSSLDSIASVGYWANDVIGKSEHVSHIAAINLGREGQSIYPTSPERLEYQKNLKIAEIEIPCMDPWIRTELEKSGMRVSHALSCKNPTNPLTAVMTQMRLRHFQREVFAQFEKIQDLLLP